MATKNYYNVGGKILGHKAQGQSRVDYLTDALGSVTTTVDQSAAVQGRKRYKPYGEALVTIGTSTEIAFSWVGIYGYRQLATKYSNVYVRARFYDDYAGRWTTMDPIRAGKNWFMYSAASPVTKVDPTGLDPVDPLLECYKRMQTAKQSACKVFDTENSRKCVENCISKYWGAKDADKRFSCLRSIVCKTGTIELIADGDGPCKPCNWPCGSTIPGQGSACKIGICQSSCAKSGPCNKINTGVIIHESLHCCENKNEVKGLTEWITWETQYCIDKCFGKK